MSTLPDKSFRGPRRPLWASATGTKLGINEAGGFVSLCLGFPVRGISAGMCACVWLKERVVAQSVWWLHLSCERVCVCNRCMLLDCFWSACVGYETVC